MARPSATPSLNTPSTPRLSYHSTTGICGQRTETDWRGRHKRGQEEKYVVEKKTNKNKGTVVVLEGYGVGFSVKGRMLFCVICVTDRNMWIEGGKFTRVLEKGNTCK